MPPEFNKYYVYDVEVTRAEQKKVLILLQTHNLSDAWWYITTLAYNKKQEAKHYQLVEREDTGCLFVRLDIVFDGRPFCVSPEDMGPGKFGYQQ